MKNEIHKKRLTKTLTKMIQNMRNHSLSFSQKEKHKNIHKKRLTKFVHKKRLTKNIHKMRNQSQKSFTKIVSQKCFTKRNSQTTEINHKPLKKVFQN